MGEVTLAADRSYHPPMSAKVANWRRMGRGDGRRPLVLAAAVTPYDDQGAVDLDGFEENLRFQDAMDIDGILVAGTTGERESLTPEERDDLVSTAKLVLDGDLVIVAGVERDATLSIDAARADVQRLADAGAAVALVPPPFEADSPLRDDGAVLEFFSELLEGAPLPVLFYHPPSFESMPLAKPVAEKLRDMPGLAGVKDSIGDRAWMEMWSKRSSPDFGVFVGSASLFTEMAADVTGGILAIASVHPSEFASFAAHVLDDPLANVALGPAQRSMKRFRAGGVKALKDIHDEIGLFGGEVR